MWIVFVSPVNFKKRLFHPVKLENLGPHLLHINMSSSILYPTKEPVSILSGTQCLLFKTADLHDFSTVTVSRTNLLSLVIIKHSLYNHSVILL